MRFCTPRIYPKFPRPATAIAALVVFCSSLAAAPILTPAPVRAVVSDNAHEAVELLRSALHLCPSHAAAVLSGTVRTLRNDLHSVSYRTTQYDNTRQAVVHSPGFFETQEDSTAQGDGFTRGHIHVRDFRSFLRAIERSNPGQPEIVHNVKKSDRAGL